MDTQNHRNNRRKAAPPGSAKQGRPGSGRTFDLKVSEQAGRQIAGFLFIGLSLFILTSIVAYFFTWQGDQSQVSGTGTWQFLWSGESVDHWMGRSGALISHLLVYRGLGPAALFIPWALLLVGIQLLFVDARLRLFARLYHSLLLMLTTSFTLAFLGNDLAGHGFAWGGMAGRAMSSWTIGFAGHLGTGFILLLYWLTYLSLRLGWVFSMAELQSRLPWMGSRARNASALPDAGGTTEGDEDAENDKGGWQAGVYVAGGTSAAGGRASTPAEPRSEPELGEVEVEDRDEPNSPAFGGAVGLEIEPSGEQDGVNPLRGGGSPAGAGVAPGAPELEIKPPVNEGLEKVADGGVALSAEQLYDPKLDLSDYKYPPIDLLEEYGNQKIQIQPDELERNKNQITDTLRHYNIGIDKIRATIGPTVTLYEIVPAAGVRISRIKNLEDDIALSLAALGIRIIAPMPGKGTIGIEVPNQSKEMVGMRSLLASEKFIKSEMELPLALGKTIANEIFIADLTKMPHLLMAGATGQGKSVGLNAMLLSLLYKKHPSELKLVLVDPKKVELSLFRHIERHFLARLPDNDEAIVTDTLRVVDTMQSLCIEMDRRYDLLKDAQVRNLSEYNEKFRKRRLLPRDGHRFLPYIVVVIDEFADLIMTAGKEIEMPIARLAQLARAVGIHLIIATQRPSVNIITGTIKANFPARIAFKVSSRIDSRTILDTGGAEQLIGRGDMLLSQGSDVIRLQCAFVDTPEVESVCNYIGGQRGYPDAYLLPEYSSRDEGGSAIDFDPSQRDPMFDEAARVIVQNQIGSTSLLQRKMKLGYNRAGRIIDQLEAAGIVGPFEGSKPREVLVGDEYSLEQLLQRLDK